MTNREVRGRWRVGAAAWSLCLVAFAGCVGGGDADAPDAQGDGDGIVWVQRDMEDYPPWPKWGWLSEYRESVLQEAPEKSNGSPRPDGGGGEAQDDVGSSSGSRDECPEDWQHLPTPRWAYVCMEVGMQDTIHLYYINPDDWDERDYYRASDFRAFLWFTDGLRVIDGKTEYAVAKEPQRAHVWATVEAVREGEQYVSLRVERDGRLEYWGEVTYYVVAE